MDIQFKIHRFDPEKDKEPYYRTYEIRAEPSDRILDCLNRIKWERDGTLSYRMSCGHGVCGSDAMRINGKCALACQKLVQEYEGETVTLEPLPSFRVQKDLMVDLKPFFKKVRLIRPYLIAHSDPPEAERIQGPKENDRLKEVIRCILCACCTASCPVTLENPEYLGPATIVRTFRFIFDTSDEESLERLKQMDVPHGVWSCVNHFECTKACPKSIPVTKSINTVKGEINKVLGPKGEG